MNSGKPHRFSGWPGAWCLDCGAEDECEICCAEHPFPACEVCGGSKPGCKDCSYTGVSICKRPECVNDFCPEPGSRNRDPYFEELQASVKRLQLRVNVAAYNTCKHCGLFFLAFTVPCMCPDAEEQVDELVRQRTASSG